MILVSACLIGCPCRYDGKSALVQSVRTLFEQGFLFPVCPEVMAGLPVARPPMVLDSLTGEAVLSGHARVVDSNNRDITDLFVSSARQCVTIAEMFSLRKAVLKSKSPSCGVHQTYTKDGLQTGSCGVTAAALRAAGLELFDETCDLNTVVYDK